MSDNNVTIRKEMLFELLNESERNGYQLAIDTLRNAMNEPQFNIPHAGYNGGGEASDWADFLEKRKKGGE